MSVFIGLSDKDLLKVNKDLLELHKKVVLNYLFAHSMKLKNRNKFFKIYNHYISTRNIHEYFFSPIKVFITLLIRDELWRIQKYHIELKHKVKKKK